MAWSLRAGLHSLGVQLWTAPAVHTLHCPQQSGMVARVIRTLKEQCVHHHRFETLQHASRAIADWAQFYNHRGAPPSAKDDGPG